METWEEFAVVTGGAAAAVIAALVGGVIGAWLLMMKTGETTSESDGLDPSSRPEA